MPNLNTGKPNYDTVYIKTIILSLNILQFLQARVKLSMLANKSQTTAKRRWVILLSEIILSVPTVQCDTITFHLGSNMLGKELKGFLFVEWLKEETQFFAFLLHLLCALARSGCCATPTPGVNMCTTSKSNAGITHMAAFVSWLLCRVRSVSVLPGPFVNKVQLKFTQSDRSLYSPPLQRAAGRLVLAAGFD